MKSLLILLAILSITACERINNKTFEIKTVDGITIKLSCPVIEPDRNEFTYIYKNDCRVLPAKE